MNKKMSVFKLACPIFFQSLLALCIGYADTVMVSHYSDYAVGAIGNANQIIGFVTLAFTVISSATGVMVAQYIGAKQTEKLNTIYSLSVFLNLLIGLVIGVLLFSFSKQLIMLIKVPDEMIELSNPYLKMVGCTMFTVALFNVFDQIARSNGKTVIGLVLALSMNAINIVGNYIFLYGPLKYLELGIRGVAISTVVSKLIGLIIAIIFFYTVIGGKISIKYLLPLPKKETKLLLSIGIPAAGENFSFDISQLIIAAFINSLGAVAVNARMYCTVLTQFSYLYSMAIAVATSIVIGQAVGANDIDYAYTRVIKTLKLAMVVSITIATINYLLSSYTLNLFTNNSEVIALGIKVMFVALILEIGRTCNIVIIYSLKAAGDVKFPTVLGIISEWAIAVLLTYIFTQYTRFGLVGAWIAMASDEILRSIIVSIRWKNKKWQTKRIIHDDIKESV